MVKDFLKKYQEELLSEKIDIKEKLDLLKTKIAEDRKFVEVLEESNNSFFSDFTPRTLNEKNKIKADELRKSIEKLEISKAELEQKISFIDIRLDEIQTLISSVNHEKKVDNTDIVNRLKQIKDYVFLDQQRAVLELEELINNL